MKAIHPITLATIAFTTGLSSCILNTNPVPEMPYRPRRVVVRTQPQQEEPTPEPTTTWETAPTPSSHITETLAERMPTAVETKPVPPLPEPPPEPKPAPEPEKPAAPALEPTPAKPITPLEITPPTPAPAPAPSAAPAAPALNSAASDADLKNITNTGPIPTAMPVDGDPTRVWNPLDPSKKIRIIDPKTNQPYPSGKKLKVRKTNFYFYVP